MFTRGVRVQLLVFAVIAVISIGYLVLGYADGERTVGLSTYRVTASFRDTSGLYPRALVTYRGVEVGRVRSLKLTTDGVDVTLVLDAGVQVPTATRAEIHSTSAIGEQYVDLVPERRAGPYLQAGSRIPRSETREMPQIAPVLDSLNRLLESIPQKETGRLLDQVGTAFGSSDTDLQQVLDSSTHLLAAATEQVDATKRLIGSVRPVLETQSDLGPATRSYMASLASLSTEVGRNDPHLRSLLVNGAPSLDAVDGLLARLSPDFAVLMANLVSSGEVLNAYDPNLKQLMVVYPALINRIQGTAAAPRNAGADRLDLKLNLDDPPSCTQGYLPHAQWRDPADTARMATPPGLHCKTPRSEEEGVRGARNLPCPNDESLRAATPAGCGLVFAGEQAGPYRAGTPTGRSDDETVAAENDGSISYELVTGRATWRDLFTGPLR